jgi:hypothetical protein
MLKNYLKEARNLNKIDLTSINGTKLYFSKLKNTLNSIVFGLMIVNCAWLIHGSIENNATVLLFMIGLLFFLYLMLESLARVIYKNPVLILSEGKLYYIKTQTWYNIEEYKFEDQHIGRLNLNLTFCMIDRKDHRIFALNNWNLHNPEDFKSKLTYQRAMIFKAKHSLS